MPRTLRALVAVLLFTSAQAQAQQPTPRRADLLITGGTVVTMDSARRVLDDGAIAIVKDRIVAVGPTREVTAAWRAARTIDARRKIVMPGLIDGHAHAGHTLVKTLGMDTDEWYPATEAIYARGSTEAFWRADARLAATERLRFGVTTSVNLFGGGDNVVRTDDVRYGNAYMQGVQEVGVRWILAVGPRRAPFPKIYTDWSGATPRDVPVSFETQMQVSEALINRWHGAANGRLRMATVFPTHNPATTPLTPAALDELRRQSRATRELATRHGVLFVQDGHTKGTVAFANELGLLGPDALLSHATDLTTDEIALLARTNTKVVHNPSANYSMRGRNPTTELIDAGVTVMLGSDGTAPDRSADMFRHIFQAGRYHRFFFRDPAVLPAGKLLEMVTVDAARAIGMEREIGALAPGMKADIILVDWMKPHLQPMNMPLYRLAYFANGNDVHTVLVDGQVLMRAGKVLTVNETAVMEDADREARAAIKRTGLDSLTRLPVGFWGTTRLPKAGR